MFKRGQTYWSALFFVLLAVSAGSAVAELSSGARRGATLALAAGLALWYWHEVVRQRERCPAPHAAAQFGDRDAGRHGQQHEEQRVPIRLPALEHSVSSLGSPKSMRGLARAASSRRTPPASSERPHRNRPPGRG